MLRPENGIRDSERSRSQIENGLLFGKFSHDSTFGLKEFNNIFIFKFVKSNQVNIQSINSMFH
jgi:hypothetical protein